MSSIQDLKEVQQLSVYRKDTLAGTLRRTPNGCQFIFDRHFIQNSDDDGIAYQTPKQEAPLNYTGVNLPPFFAGLLPEGLRLKSIVKKLKTSEDDLFSILAAIGERCIGDVYIKEKKAPSRTNEIKNLKDIDFYQLFEENLSGEEVNPNDDALAGVQEKISASMISFPLRFAKRNKSYILKLNPKDKPNLVDNEYLTLKIAHKCGLAVNNANLVKDKNSNAGLLVERFDRQLINQKIVMIHQEDACQFLNRYPADKYRLTFKDVCNGINQLATAPIIEIQKAMQLYAFSYLIGNGDLHAKNISLQTDPTTHRIQITPNYDLICTYVYKDRKMALKLNGRDDNIKRTDFVQFASRYNINEKAMHLMLNKLIQKFSTHAPLLLEILSEKDQRLFKEMTEKRINDLK